MITIDYDFSGLSGYYHCPACADTLSVPFGIDGRPGVISPKPQDLIVQHHDNAGFARDQMPQCPNVAQWQSTPWQLRDITNTPRVLQSGQVSVDPRGTIKVQ